jgi:hypothetical protein
MAKRPKMQRDAVSPFRGKLWELFKEQASGMDGGDVVLLSELTRDALG